MIECKTDGWGVQLVIARCDDCGTVVAVATRQENLQRRLRRSQRHGWRPGLPIFCADQVACGERVWQRYGRYLQRLIDEQTAAMSSGKRKA